MGRRWIVVTGSPRSGTTAVGELLARAVRGIELYEPMNGVAGDRSIRHYFEVPGSSDFSLVDFADFSRRLQHKRLSLGSGVWQRDRGLRRLVKHVTGSQTKMTYRRYRYAPGSRPVVWKDPFAIFCLPHLADSFDDVSAVVTYREPAAVAASFERLHWGFDVLDLQSRLASAGYRLPLPDLDYSEPVFNALATWLLVYGWAVEHAPADTLFLHNGAVSGRDAVALARVSTALRLERPLTDFLPEVRAAAAAEDGVVPLGTHAHPRRRDVSSVNSYWRRLLDDETVEIIDAATQATWQRLNDRAGIVG